MADPNRGESLDPWLTLAEIANELRVNPATVRQWVSKGQLQASRAGVRKWIVRRSELQRMLAEANQLADTSRPPADRSASGLQEDEREEPGPETSGDGTHAIALIQIAAGRFDDALAASVLAPPSAGYLDRLRQIAHASEQIASTLVNAANTAGVRWAPRSGFLEGGAPWELRAEGNRLGSRELWADFDSALERLQIAVTGTDLGAVAEGFRELAESLLRVVDGLQGADGGQRDEQLG